LDAVVQQPNWEGPRLACDLSIDRPGAIVHNELVLSGWAVSPLGISGVVVQIDDRLLHASYGLETSWTAESMPEIPGADRAGYRLEIDTSTWAPGPREVTITAYDQEGSRGDIVGEVEVVPFQPPGYTKEANLAAIAAGGIALQLDAPSTAEPVPEIEGPVEIAGWAYAAEGVEAVLVTIDGRDRYEALRPIARPDLLDDYGEDVAATAGFVLRLHPRDCPPGGHRLSVVAIAGERRAVGVETDFVCLPEAPPTERPAPGAQMPIEWLPSRAPARPRSSSADRYDPERHAGLLLEAECQLRYLLAASLAAGRDVLDAGCGSGWGTALLAEAGATSVVGLDVDEQALEGARRRTAEAGVELQSGDLAALPFDDASFDLVVCFETIEHLARPDAALEELRRVLRPDGVLLITAPRRASNGRIAAGHAIPGGLDRALRDRFANVRVHRQRTFLGSAVTDDETLAAADGSEDLEIGVRKIGAERPGGEAHTLAAASDGELPELRPLAMLAPSAAARRLHGTVEMWRDRALLAEADAAASRNQANLARMHQEASAWTLEDARTRVRELTHALDAMRTTLEDAQRRESESREKLEQQAARIGEQEEQLERQADELEQRAARISEQAERLELIETGLMDASSKIAAYDGSLSWRITRPLRAIMQVVRRSPRP
jgi:SAM-dependent methyltransferase